MTNLCISWPSELIKNSDIFRIPWLSVESGTIVLYFWEKIRNYIHSNSYFFDRITLLLCAGFLPEEWDRLLVKYLYPTFTPTVLLFIGGSVLYGVAKYLEGEKNKEWKMILIRSSLQIWIQGTQYSFKLANSLLSENFHLEISQSCS